MMIMFRWCFGWANYDTPPKSRGSRLVQEPDPHHGNLREGQRPSFSLRESEYQWKTCRKPCFFSLKFFHLVPIKPRIRPGSTRRCTCSPPIAVRGSIPSNLGRAQNWTGWHQQNLGSMNPTKMSILVKLWVCLKIGYNPNRISFYERMMV